MKKLLLALVVLAGISVPATAGWSSSFVSISTFTPPATGSYAWAFKNASSVYDVRIERLEVGTFTDGTAVSGGLMQFDLYAASALTNGGTVQVSTYSYDRTQYPASVQASTGPVSVTIENKGSMQLPMIPGITVNDDETATANLVQVYDFGSPSLNLQPMILPRGGTRSIVAKKKQIGASDYTAGVVYFKVVFSVSTR